MRPLNAFLCGCLLLVPRLVGTASVAQGSSRFVNVVSERDTTHVDGVLDVHRGFADPSGVERALLVLLPPSYREGSTREYPVLYALDGRLLFEASRATGDEWTLDEILARHPAGVPEVLVVSLDSGREARRDHAPPGSIPEARGDELLRFLTDVAQPFVAGTYRIRPEREATFLLGTGDSALFALYAAWRRSDRFAGAIALECPDVDAHSMEWMHESVPAQRPWIWFEQVSTDKPRPSGADFLALLKQHADVQHLVTGSGSSRTSRLLAALRGCPWP
jgi:hypothetical protein